MKIDFDEVVHLHWRRIFQFIALMVGDSDLATDLTQDCFCRAYRGWSDFRGDSTAHTWLRRIALNVIKNSLRAKTVHARRFGASIDGIDEDYLTDHMTGSPEANVLRQHVLQLVWKAAEHVSPRQQVALQLRFVEDLDIAKIAAVMKVTEGSVKVHLSRAVESIRSSVSRSTHRVR